MGNTLVSKWVSELTSDQYKQTRHMLCNVGEDGGKSYCCLGVAAESVLGRKFQKNGGYTSNSYVYFSLLSPEDKTTLGLDKKLTVSELKLLMRSLNRPTREIDLLDMPTDRESALTHMNDNGASFATIADFIVEAGWDNA